MGMTKDTKAASERLLNIVWRNEDEDSTRNPVVEAHEEAMREAEQTSQRVPTDMSVRPQSKAAAALSGLSAASLDDEELTELFGARAKFDQDAPELVSDQSDYLDAGNRLTQAVAASIRLDEVLAQITPYTAMRELQVSPNSMLGRTMLANANALLSTLFLNLQADYGYADIYTEGLDGVADGAEDATELAINEVLRLQGLKSQA